MDKPLRQELSHCGRDGEMRSTWIPAFAGMSALVKALHLHGGSPCRGKPEPRSRRQLRRREAGWRAAGGELAVRRMTNSIRRGVTTSLLIHGEVRNSSGTLKLACKAMPGYTAWLEAERWEGVARQAGRPARAVKRAGVRAFVVP